MAKQSLKCGPIGPVIGSATEQHSKEKAHYPHNDYGNQCPRHQVEDVTSKDPSIEEKNRELS